MDPQMKLGVPYRRKPDTDRPITYIPQLFRRKPEDFLPYNVNDPFIHPDALKEYCSIRLHGEEPHLFSLQHKTLDDIIGLGDEEFDAIEKLQVMREKKAEAAAKIEEEKLNKEKEVLDVQKKTLDKQVDEYFSKYCHFVKKPCPVMIPYKSCLNHDEHKAYLRAFKKFKIRPPKTPAEFAEQEYYLRLQSRVFEEQKCFMEFSYQVSRLQLKAYNEVPKAVNSFIDDYVVERGKLSLDYKDNYIQEQDIPICPQDHENRFNDLYFKHTGHVLSLGCVPWMQMPNMQMLFELPLDETVKENLKSLDEAVDKEMYLHKTPVSQDPNAAYIAQNHKANIVISSSALKVLAADPGPNFDKEWDIPVIVRTCYTTDSSGKEVSHRVTFIDKPMPKVVWTPSEKKRQFYKKACIMSLTQIKSIPFLRMRCPLVFRYEKVNPELIENSDANEKPAAPDYSEDMFDLYSAPDTDIFGSLNPIKQTNKQTDIFGLPLSPSKRVQPDKECVSTKEVSENDLNYIDNLGKPSKRIKMNEEPEKTLSGTTERKSAENNESPSGTMEKNSVENVKLLSNTSSSVLDNLLDMQDTLLKPSTTNEGSSGNKDDKEPLSRGDKLWPWSGTIQTDWNHHKNSLNMKKWSGDNVHYQLFEMGFHNSKPYSSSQPIKVLVRHNLHAVTKYRKQPNESKAFVIHPKPEYQAYFGCEVNTLAEITQQWADLLIRPNTTLLQVRICETTGEIIQTDQKTLSLIIKEGKQPHINFNPLQPLSTLHTVFNSLSKLPTGEYLLHHDAKTEAFIKLMKAIDLENEPCSVPPFNLHSHYASSSAYTRTHAKPPWLAIDTHVLTAFHRKHYKIPATFPMENPTKKLSKRDKKKIRDKAKNKQRLDDIQKLKASETHESQEF